MASPGDSCAGGCLGTDDVCKGIKTGLWGKKRLKKKKNYVENMDGGGIHGKERHRRMKRIRRRGLSYLTNLNNFNE